MLNRLKNKIAALQKFSFGDELKKIVEDNKDKLADLQRDQLVKGKDSNNNYIKLKDNHSYGGGYRPFTINEKQRYGKGTGAIVGHITWFMTGKLHESIRAFISGDKFRLKSHDFKFEKLIIRSGEEAIGLNADSRREFVTEVTRPNILKVYQEKVAGV